MGFVPQASPGRGKGVSIRVNGEDPVQPRHRFKRCIAEAIGTAVTRRRKRRKRRNKQ
jgi:hypothetical protein